jgi:hypothetical protein
VKRAAEQFDLGVAAFKAKQFDEAAQHFEAADEAVPGVKTLRLAIRARTEAGQGSRAATLAAQALDRYADRRRHGEAREGDDPALRGASSTRSGELRLAVPARGRDARRARGLATTRWVVYLEPGKTTRQRELLRQHLREAALHRRRRGRLLGGPLRAPEPPKVIPSDGARRHRDLDEQRAVPRPHERRSRPRRSTATSRRGPDDKPPVSKGIHPAFFGVGLGAHRGRRRRARVERRRHPAEPGTDKVREGVRGQGPRLPGIQARPRQPAPHQHPRRRRPRASARSPSCSRSSRAGAAARRPRRPPCSRPPPCSIAAPRSASREP